jgi:hypothetical protein
MKDSSKKKNNSKIILDDITRFNKIKNSLTASKFLENAIKRYQTDIVGWTEYCIDNKNINDKALPIYRQKPLENLRLQNKIISSLSNPPIKKIYDSQNHYVRWLDEEYNRDQAFYEAILKNPSKFTYDQEDILLNKEIDQSAKKYLKTIEKRKIDEEVLIRSIQNDSWHRIKKSKFPKVQLGVTLGAHGDAIVNNFCVYFINQLMAFLAGSKTAFLSLTGPATWYEIDQCKAELSYFKKEVVDPIIKNLK